MKKDLLKNAKPILFNTEIVKAILDGRKTQFRKVVKLPDCKWSNGNKTKVNIDQVYLRDNFFSNDSKEKIIELNGLGDNQDYLEKDFIEDFAKYKVGDVLYVKETFRITQGGGFIIFKAGQNNLDVSNEEFLKDVDSIKWESAIHLTKEYARIFLKVTNVRVERLHDITFQNILSEGFKYDNDFEIASGRELNKWWINIWNSTAKDGYKWEDNPYVFVYEFERVD